MLSDAWNQLIAWTGRLVAPDWGALVALIPILLLVVVLAFAVITALKWVNAGPARRGPGRRPPLAPDGTPIHGPSPAPLVIAAGASLLAFGLVAGGPWLPAGVLVAGAGVLWWAAGVLGGGRRRGGSANGAGAGGRPASVPAPRRRVSPARAAVIGVALVVLLTLVLTSKVVPEGAGPGASGSPAGGSPVSGVPATSEPSLPAADLTLTAQNIAFSETSLTGPAGRSFTVAFDNRDTAPHNLEIKDAGGATRFMGEIVTGPAVKVYDVPALPAGTYPFICTVHPAMTGTLTVK